LSEFIPNYRLAFGLVGAGAVLVLTIEQISITLMSVWKYKPAHTTTTISSTTFIESETISSNTTDSVPGTTIATSDNSKEVDLELAVVATEHEDTSQCHCEHAHTADVLDGVTKAHNFKDLMFLYSLELSVTVHSIILGVEFGLETNWMTLVALAIAMSFHQTIEGIAMGAAIANLPSALSDWKLVGVLLIFASSISIGVIIGLGSSFGQESDAGEITQGVFSCLAAGSLLYVSFCEQLAVCFNKEELERNLGLKIAMIIAFSLGFASMSVLSIWE
jgi:zinc transporter ZupT